MEAFFFVTNSSAGPWPIVCVQTALELSSFCENRTILCTKYLAVDTYITNIA
jgi:hypothetical protein